MAGVPTGSLRRRNLADRLARWVVSAGGIAIIASVLGIFVFIVFEVLPLLGGADAEPRPSIALGSGARAVGAGVDEYETVGFVVSSAGRLEYFALEKDAVPVAVPLAGAAGREIRSAFFPLGRTEMALGTSDGFVLPLTLGFEISFDKGSSGAKRRVTPRLTEEA
ncbi:MAG TPA: hypothetical protein VK661_11835, partial [Planctomycetota bacterium]|nr:hypothetical protein [Planctomycetota bacterium]